MLQSKSTVVKTNDENVEPKVHHVKTVTETYKAFVSVTSTTVDGQITDENRPPKNDEVDHAIANCSFSGIRYRFLRLFLMCALFFFYNNFNEYCDSCY